MPIDFRCPGCQNLLRVGDGDAGKQAKCPQCGAIVTIPAVSQKGGYAPMTPAEGHENPYVSPGDQNSAVEEGRGVIVPSLLDFGGVFAATWNIFRTCWGLCLGGFVLVGLVSFAASGMMQGSLMVVAKQVGPEGLVETMSVVGTLAGFAFSMWLQAGSCRFFLSIARRGDANIAELFSGGPWLLPVLGGSILYSLICLGGYLLLIVPGVIFSLMFSQYMYLIVDQNLGVSDSLAVSRRVMAGNKLMLLLVGAVAGSVGSMITLCTCLLGGILFVFPFLSLMSAVIYLTVSGQRIWTPPN
jgi:hypothetical protein